MKIHKYFFWIEDNFIEIYKDGKLEKYDGEEKTYINKLDEFWKKWEKNSKIILSRDKVNFTFLIDEKIDRGSLFESIKKYQKDFSYEFSSEDLKKILDIKNIEKVIFNFNKEEVAIAKTIEKYVETEFDEELIKIFLLGNNINKDILKEILNQRVEDNEKEDIHECLLDSYFREKWKNKK